LCAAIYSGQDIWIEEIKAGGSMASAGEPQPQLRLLYIYADRETGMDGPTALLVA